MALPFDRDKALELQFDDNFTISYGENSDEADAGMQKQTSNKKHLTKVRPFTFECEKRAALRSADAAVSSSNSLQVPMAEFITNYQTSTPPRFRHAPSTPGPNRTGPHETGSELGPGHLTIAKTPKLLTKGRKRLTAKGAKEMEEEEILKMKQHQFKARPFNRDIINKDGLCGVPLKRTAEVTQPITPDLTSTRVMKKRKTMYDEQETSHKDMDKQFHARPMPDFKKVKGVPAKRIPSLTEPETPTVMKRRHQCYSSSIVWKEDGVTEPEARGHFVKPMPNFDKRFEVKYAERQQVVPQPFSFDARERNKATLKPAAEEKFVFKAQLLPDFSKIWRPTKHASPIKSAPFMLHTEIRGEKYANKWKKEVEEKLQKEKEEAEFKSKKNVSAVLYSEPFIPEKSRHPLTQVDNFVLHSELRSIQRMKYDIENRQKNSLLEMNSLQRQALREVSEAKEVAAFRKTLVHKAKPIPH